MLQDSFHRFYNRLRLMQYRELFGRIREKDGSLSATEAFAVDVIYLMGNPTITQFSETIGVSQPNATYKINNLAAKGYVTKTVPEDDKRECRIAVSDKFFRYFDSHTRFTDSMQETLEKEYTPEQIRLFSDMLDTLCREDTP